MRIAVVQGTRPEIAKNYSVVRALRASGVPFEVFHTSQHSHVSMCDHVYSDMGYQPDRVFPAPHRMGAVVDWLAEAFERDEFTAVIVNGDTTAALVGALAGMYTDVTVAHVEAGLRSRDPYMREERNRIMVDSIAQLLFAYTQFEVEVLRRSEDVRGEVRLLGNTTVDLLHDFGHRLVPPADPPYLYVTLHRKELTDSRRRMVDVFGALARLAEGGQRVIFPMHPRTTHAMARHDVPRGTLGRVAVVPPLGIFTSLALQKHAAAVLTDSGCIQEEAYLLGTRCVTIRENTERHLTVEHGANTLTGFDADTIVTVARAAAETPGHGWPPIYGRPGAGERIVDAVVRYCMNAAASGEVLVPEAATS